MTQRPYDLADSSEKLDMLLKKIAVLENMVLMGNKVYRGDYPEQIAGVLLQAKVSVEKPVVMIGEIFSLEIEIANFGSSPATLNGVEELLPCCGMEMVTTPEPYHLDGSYLGLHRKTLQSSMTEKLRLTVRATEKGTHAITPRIAYTDGVGAQRIIDLKPTTIEVKEVLLPDRVSTGYKDLDNLLLGGIPKNYAVVLTSISCDETKLLISRFVERGAREGETTLLLAIEAGRWEKLAGKFPNFNLFAYSPQVETPTKVLPNVVTVRGVENLTEVNIPLISALRKLDAPNDKPRRICIEILSDILLQHRAVQTRRWLITLIAELKSRGFTTLAVINPYMHPAEEVQAVLDLFDGEIEVYEKENQKFLRIKKMYEQNYIESELPLRKNRLSRIGIARRLKYTRY